MVYSNVVAGHSNNANIPRFVDASGGHTDCSESTESVLPRLVAGHDDDRAIMIPASAWRPSE